MKNKKVKIILIISVVIVFSALILVMFFSKKSGESHRQGLKDMFFKSSDENYAKEIINNNVEKYSIDEYTIALEESLYDKETNIGYCVFSIIKKDGKPEIELNEWKQSVTDGYGENSRFRMKQFASQESKFEIVGNTLYQYFSFRADEDFNGKVTIVDSKNGNSKYKYTLSDIGKSDEYLLDENTKITISPIGIIVKSNSEFHGKIALHYKQGTEEIVLDTKKEKGTGLSRVSTINNSFRSQYVFGELKQVENVDYILCNGEKILKSFR